ncbi:MAG: menaquinone biosynthesis protein [Acidobacteriaceae bacterium]
MSTSVASGRLRVSAISYLNTVPLMYDFTHPPMREQLKERFDVHFTLPSVCAGELAEDTADIGIIPVAAYTSVPELHIIPGVAIAAKHPVRSILLVSKKPLPEVRSVAADSSSRTSVALLKVLFERKFGGRPEYVAEAPELASMLARHDAALLIGDPALRVDVGNSAYSCVDLAEEWQKMTGLPFVFAFWAVREDALRLARDFDVNAVFQGSRDRGLANLEELAAENAERYCVPGEVAQRYLSYHLDYALDPANLDGLRLFYRYAAECGALAVGPELRLV